MGYGILADELRARAADPVLAGRLRVLPAVPPNELIGWVASADVAAMPIQPTTLNHRLTTPNKLFEAMAAGVPSIEATVKITTPGDLPETLRKAGLEWPINGMSWTTYRNRPDAYLDEAFDVTGKRIAAAMP